MHDKYSIPPPPDIPKPAKWSRYVRELASHAVKLAAGLDGDLFSQELLGDDHPHRSGPVDPRYTSVMRDSLRRYLPEAAEFYSRVCSLMSSLELGTPVERSEAQLLVWLKIFGHHLERRNVYERKSSSSTILRGITRGPWSVWWARNTPEGRRAGENNCYDFCPPPPKWAESWGRRIAHEIVSSNDHLELSTLFEVCVQHGQPEDGESWGWQLGMQAASLDYMGSPISWDENLNADHPLAISVPQLRYGPHRKKSS